MNCCIGRCAKFNNSDNSPQISPRELKKKLQSIDSQKSMVDIFTSVMESENERSTLHKHFEEQHSPELPYYIEDFIKWENAPTREGAENIFRKYFTSDSPFLLDVQNGDEKRIKFLLSDYNANSSLMHDMFIKYAMSSTKDIKNSFNPKP